MNILVTGANGFIGSKLCERLIQDGHKVRGLVRPGSDLRFIENLDRLDVFEGDISEIKTLYAPMKGVKLVFHVAAYTLDWGPWAVFEKYNIKGVANVMEAALQSGVQKIVHTSSSSVYGFPGKIDITENDPRMERPTEPYIKSKLEGEQIALSYNSKQMGVAVLRPTTVFGPNDRTTSLQFIPELQKRGMPYVGKGRYYMAPLYIDNLIDAYLKAAKTDKSNGQVYNVNDSGYMTWKEYFDAFCKELNVKPPLFSVPSGAAKALAAVVEDFSKLIGKKEAPMITRFRIMAVTADQHYNIEKAVQEIGYDPKVSTLEGIKKTVEWYKTYIEKQAHYQKRDGK